MSTSPDPGRLDSPGLGNPTGQPEYEFNIPQSGLMASLGRRLGAVGMLLILIGVLNIINGVVSAYVGYKHPDRIVKAITDNAKDLPADKVEAIKNTLSSGGVLPFVATGVAIAALGLINFLFGLWINKAGVNFTLVATTRGKDITRLMEALENLNKAFGLIYNLMIFVAIVFVVSLVMQLLAR